MFNGNPRYLFLVLGLENLKNKLYNVGFTVETIFIESKSTGIYFEHLTF